MVMYIVEVSPQRTDTLAYGLLSELIKAKKRGVAVKVILDQNIDFVRKRYASDWRAQRKSYWCFKMLKDAGIDVSYDDITNYTHAKAIIVDEEIVISGSANWTQAGLARSVEVNTLIKSKEFVKELLAYFAKIKPDKESGKSTEWTQPGLNLSWEFLKNSSLAPQMMKRADERAFDVYLLLLREFNYERNPEISLKYDEIARALGLSEKMDRLAYRRQINKTLKKLEAGYRLIKCETGYDRQAKVTLLDYEQKNNIYAELEKDYFKLPLAFFDYGWQRELSMRAKFCYLVCAANNSISDSPPWWSESTKSLSKQFGGVSIFVFQKGMGELRKRKLLDVLYDVLVKEPDKRLPKAYKLLELYDPNELEERLAYLEEGYGQKRYREARRYAEIVFEENNYEVIEDIIKSMDIYGEDKVREAFSIAAKKRVDNPKRKYSYVVGILKKTAQ
jgi:hypothetical protein